MPNAFEKEISRPTQISETTREDNVSQFGNPSSYADQMSALRKDDELKSSTMMFMLAQADGDFCHPTDGKDAYEKFRVCIETRALRRALKAKDKHDIKESCDEINSNRDARVVYNQLTSSEKELVQIKSEEKAPGHVREILSPAPEKKSN